MRRRSENSVFIGKNGGGGGIRTPGALAGTHDFESCAFNQALPPLRVDYQALMKEQAIWTLKFVPSLCHIRIA